MYLRAALITIKQVTLAVVQVDPESTYPVPGAVMLQRAQLIFPTLPIVLLSPRVGGFSRSYATFELNHMIGAINADEIDWREYCSSAADESPPF
jgi:hypothetical protein